jgi:hypothetical protein
MTALSILLRLVLLLAGAVAGAGLGLLGGILVACTVLQLGNLCGLFGYFVTAPLAGLIGAFAGWRAGAFAAAALSEPPKAP